MQDSPTPLDVRQKKHWRQTQSYEISNETHRQLLEVIAFNNKLLQLIAILQWSWQRSQLIVSETWKPVLTMTNNS